MDITQFYYVAFNLRRELANTVNHMLELFSYEPIKRVKMLTY